MHQSLCLAEFVVGVLGEVFRAQRFDRRESQRHVGLVGVARALAGVPAFVDGECHRVFADGLEVFAGRQAFPKHGERDIERLAVFRLAHERGVRGPVHAVAVGDADGVETLHERDDGVERHAQPRASKHSPEGDGHPFGSH